MGRPETRDPVLRKAIGRLRPLSPETLILFGSRARGDALETSDYDFIIVSSRFRSIPFLDRAPRVLRRLADLPASFDILCYTPEEFEKKRNELGTVAVAVKEGVEV